MLAGIIDLLMSFMSMWAIDGFMYPGTTDKIGLFAAAAFGLQALTAVLTLIFCRSAGYLEAHMNTDIRRAAYLKLQTMSFSFFDNTSVGYLLSRLTNDISRIMEIISWVCIDLGWSIMAVIASIIAMFVVNFKLALITITAVPFVALLSVYFQKKILKYQRE
ncbi:MAG: ABC transporter ATP-binding protein, partial [Papillibacter sp.]|nr:ABC transporter ATP-binding protein [Papillibacter sp.]